MSLLQRMADHDASEERRYLREGGRLNLTWSWLWLTPLVGIGATTDPGSDEAWSLWVSVGPLTVEAYWRSGPSA